MARSLRMHACPPGPELRENVNFTALRGIVCRLNHATQERASVASSGVARVVIFGDLGNEVAP
jgi:hypothetical protein